MLCRVALVRTDVSEEHVAFIIRMRRIGELGTTLAVTSNRSTLRHGLTSQKTAFFNLQQVWAVTVVDVSVFGIVRLFAMVSDRYCLEGGGEEP
jgi:hypothetical protein